MTEKLLTFPCDFPLKVVGHNQPSFEQEILEIVRKHCPDLSEQSVSQRLSKDNKYLSLTINIVATSQQHLDDLYQELTDSKQTLMVL